MGVGRLGCTIAGGRIVPLCGRNDAGRMTRLAGYLLPLPLPSPPPLPPPPLQLGRHIPGTVFSLLNANPIGGTWPTPWYYRVTRRWRSRPSVSLVTFRVG
jgi:hypothetical protein